jgi:hypothetical protein
VVDGPHRVTADSASVYVDDSRKTVSALVLEFLADFADSTVTPEHCVRNFLDSCRGKQSELEDVINNRKNYWILEHEAVVTDVTFNVGRTQATVVAPCSFTSRKLTDGPDGKTGSIVTAEGNCTLDVRYDNNRWWLCDSRLRDPNSVGLHFMF